MPFTTTALVTAAVNAPFELKEIEVDDPRAGEVVVTFSATGLCHSDVATQQGGIPFPFPNVLGHEGAGEVIKVGEGVTALKLGDKVLTSIASCSTCKGCKKGIAGACKSYWPLNLGGVRPDGTATSGTDKQSGERLAMNFLGQSSFAKEAVVSANVCVKVASDIDLTLLAPLGCGVQTGYGAVSNILRPPAGSTILITGMGTVGMSALFAAKNLGLGTIVVSDLDDGRLKLAKELGATHTVNAKDPELAAKVVEACDGEGPEYVAECSGAIPAMKAAYDVLASHGYFAQVGVPRQGTLPPFDIQTHIGSGKHYIGALEGLSNPPVFIPELLKLYQDGKLPLDRITKVYKIADYEQALEETHSGKVIKAVLLH